jgi:excisionase family DNA binding protein
MNSTDTCGNEPKQSLWTTSELAGYLGCSERQVFALRKRGLPTIQVGGLIRFSPSRVMAWLESRDLGHNASDERACQLADITATMDDDNAECAAADQFREFPPAP